MEDSERIAQIYQDHLPGAKLEKSILKAPCPFCTQIGRSKPGLLVVVMNPDSHFMGYFRCLHRCRPGGFPLHFGRLMGIEPSKIPGYDPDREPFVREILFPTKNLKPELIKFRSLMTESEYEHFKDFGVSKSVVDEMNIGYNGRYLVYPYYLEDGNCYAAHCILPARKEDHFWHGDDKFVSGEFQIYDFPEIDRCEGGALFIAEGEDNLLALRELGYPGIAVPSAGDLEHIQPERLAYIQQVYIVVSNTPEAHLAARALATRLGFKVRILKWPADVRRGTNLSDLARIKKKKFRGSVAAMIKSAKSFSPFTSPEREHRFFVESLEKTKGRELIGRQSGFEKLDVSLSGIRGLNIMGGPPKAGKSCFYMQISTEMARRQTPVIYYDFENGRQKILSRTLCRIGRLTEADIRLKYDDARVSQALQKAHHHIKQLLSYFRVVTDRKLNPDIMRRQIDFLQHETRKDFTVVVVDSLHKLPFKDLSDRRTGIDSWLRHMEAIRDEQNVAFFVISELSRSTGGSYDQKPDLGSFKESGDIEYSADNAMVLLPNWDLLEPISTSNRESTLWLVASRENNPGKIATYRLQYPYWGFQET